MDRYFTRLIVCTAFHMCGVPRRLLAAVFMLPRRDAPYQQLAGVVSGLETVS